MPPVESTAIALTPARIWAEAREAARNAAKAANDALPAENRRGFDCGFAWVNIRPARGPFISYLKAREIGRSGSSSGGPGYRLSAETMHGLPTQSISVHEAAAKAAAEVLTRYGIDASVSSRLD